MTSTTEQQSRALEIAEEARETLRAAAECKAVEADKGEWEAEKLAVAKHQGSYAELREEAYIIRETGGPEEYARYAAWQEQEEKRGELAGSPDYMRCSICSRARRASVERKVVKLGGIAESRRDPTQTYVLSCGHTEIAA